ncbi:MAG: hypothetical protein AAGF32_03525 [Pseudomonadota bacterium]
MVPAVRITINAPAPTLGCPNDGAVDQRTERAGVASLIGARRRAPPGSIQASNNGAVTRRCAAFSVPLNSASLN